MRCLYLSGSEIQYRSNHPVLSDQSDLIPVDVILAGICETDLQLQQGYMGFQGIPGHEFVGVARSGRLAGRRVVGEINCGCSVCQFCRSGVARHCPHRTVIGILNHDGAFADCVLVPEDNLHAVPDNVTDRQAVFTEPLAAACRIPEQLRIAGSDKVVVIGDGRLGHLCAAVLANFSEDVCVIGKHRWKLELLTELGISTAVKDEVVPDHRADVVVDCTGSSSGLPMALGLVKPCGTVVLKTTVAENHSLSLAPIVIDEVSVIGSRCGPFAPALQLLERKLVDVERLISAEYALADGVNAFRKAQQPDTLKVLIRIQE